MPTSEFHRHPDNLIYVRTNGGTYIDTPENFQADFSVTLDPLPAGANEQIYTQGKRHAFMADGSVVEGGPMPWLEGNEIIDAIAVGLAAQAVRQEK